MDNHESSKKNPTLHLAPAHLVKEHATSASDSHAMSRSFTSHARYSGCVKNRQEFM